MNKLYTLSWCKCCREEDRLMIEFLQERRLEVEVFDVVYSGNWGEYRDLKKSCSGIPELPFLMLNDGKSPADFCSLKDLEYVFAS